MPRMMPTSIRAIPPISRCTALPFLFAPPEEGRSPRPLRETTFTFRLAFEREEDERDAPLLDELPLFGFFVLEGLPDLFVDIGEKPFV